MLKRLRLHNFRTYVEAEIDFSQRHLLIGKNNSGKSNLCFAIRFLGATASRPLSESAAASIPGGLLEFTHFGLKSRVAEFTITAELGDYRQPSRYEYSLFIEVLDAGAGTAVPGSGLRVARERLTVTASEQPEECILESDGQEAAILQEPDESNAAPREAQRIRTPQPANATMLSALYESKSNRRAVLFRRFLQTWSYFSFVPESIRWGWKEVKDAAAYFVDGKHVAATIFHLKNQDDQRYRRLIDRVKVLEPSLLAISFYVAPDQGILPFVELKDRKKASWAGLSDGTLRGLAFSHLIEAADAMREMENWPSPLIIIEEPENGIYGGFLRKLLEDFDNDAPQAQFVFTSHSPYVIDLFDYQPESVTLIRREEERSTIKRLEKETGLPAPDARLSLSDKYFAEILG